MTEARHTIKPCSTLFQSIIVGALSTKYGRFTLKAERYNKRAILAFESRTEGHICRRNTCDTNTAIIAMCTKLHKMNAWLTFIACIDGERIIHASSANCLRGTLLTVVQKRNARITS